MNKLIHTLQMALLAMLMGMTAACTPDSYDLEAPDVASEDLVEGIAYTITHDSENPNIVYLRSLMPSSYQVCWEHPQGRAQGAEVTLQMPFEGEYEVRFGVQTRGGVVYGPTATFTIDDFYAGFVNDDLWTYLTGGVDQEKTWIFDNGEYGFAAGELTYADPSGTVTWNNWTANWDPGVGHTGDDAIWESTMTFNLQGGANVTVYNSSSDETQTGTFMLNTDSHTITFTDCDLLHTPSWSDRTTNWRRDLQLLELDENHLRIGVMRDNSEGPWWLIWNFVSKEYADNYVPEDQPDPEPTLPDGWQDMVSEVVTSEIKWTMSPDVPFDWANLDGSLMNNFTAGNYPDWATVVDGLENLSMTLNSADMTYTFEMPDGTTTSGTYTLDEDGIYTFSAGVPTYHIGGGDIMFSATAENQLRILSIETAGNSVMGMWLGNRSTEKDEYLAYHFLPNAGSGSGTPTATEIAVDNSKIVCGHLEEATNNFRIELYNMYGSTASNRPFDPASIVFDYSMELTFTISGLTGAAATNAYTAQLMCTADGWWPSVGEGQGTTTVQGDGTYTIRYSPSAAYNGVIVFCIDIQEMFSDIENPDAVTVTIDNLSIL